MKSRWMGKSLAMLAATLTIGWAMAALAQEADEAVDEEAVEDEAADIDSEIDQLKTELLDATPGYYVSPYLSGAFLNGTLEQDGVAFDFDGYLVSAGGVVGYQIDNLRVDLKGAIGTSEVDVDDLNQSFDIISFELSVNGYYDAPFDVGALIHERLPSIIPYVGAGLGWVWLDVDQSGSDGGVLTQGMAGLGIRLTPRITLDAGYRYFYIPRIEPGVADDEIDSHSAELKLRYRF